MSNNKNVKPNVSNVDNISPKSTLNDEMSNNKNVKPNISNVDSISPKGTLNDEMSNNKNIKPNVSNVDNISPKSALNDEMSNNKNVKPNISNVDNISPKSTLNDEIGSNKDKSGVENSKFKESNSNSDLNDNTKEKVLVGKMENRTIGEYVKDKVKSSKFLDNLNKSYNLGKNTTSKWNIKNKKNKES